MYIMCIKLIFPQADRVVSAWGGQRIGIGVEGHRARSGEISYGLVTRCFVGHNWEAEYFFSKCRSGHWRSFGRSSQNHFAYDSHLILIVNLGHTDLPSRLLELIRRETERQAPHVSRWHRV